MAGVPEFDGPKTTSPLVTDATYDDDASRARALQLPNTTYPRGVFGPHPLSTPKYAFNNGPREGDFRDSLARLFIQVNPKELKPFLESVGTEGGEATKNIAKVLAGTNAGGDGSGGVGYIDFLLQQVQHSFQEKQDVVEMLSDNYVVYSFGQAPPMFSYAGTLINSKQDDQAMQMFRIYRDMARGSQLAKRRKLIRIRYDAMIVSGIMSSLNWSLQADNEMLCPFNFSILVKSISLLPNEDAGLTVVAGDQPFGPQDLVPVMTSGVVQTNVRRVQLTGLPQTYSNSVKTSDTTKE